MRLIDVDKLIDAFGVRGCRKYESQEAYDTLMLYEILQVIEDQPTAYDVGKVISELECYAYCKDIPTYDHPYASGSVIDEEKAIDIVKQGGINRDWSEVE